MMTVNKFVRFMPKPTLCINCINHDISSRYILFSLKCICVYPKVKIQTKYRHYICSILQWTHNLPTTNIKMSCRNVTKYIFVTLVFIQHSRRIMRALLITICMTSVIFATLSQIEIARTLHIQSFHFNWVKFKQIYELGSLKFVQMK